MVAFTRTGQSSFLDQAFEIEFCLTHFWYLGTGLPFLFSTYIVFRIVLEATLTVFTPNLPWLWFLGLS